MPVGVCIARAMAIGARCAVHTKCSGQETSESHKACVAILHNHIHRWAINRSSSRISWQPKRTPVTDSCEQQHCSGIEIAVTVSGYVFAVRRMQAWPPWRHTHWSNAYSTTHTALTPATQMRIICNSTHQIYTAFHWTNVWADKLRSLWDVSCITVLQCPNKLSTLAQAQELLMCSMEPYPEILGLCKIYSWDYNQIHSLGHN